MPKECMPRKKRKSFSNQQPLTHTVLIINAFHRITTNCIFWGKFNVHNIFPQYPLRIPWTVTNIFLLSSYHNIVWNILLWKYHVGIWLSSTSMSSFKNIMTPPIAKIYKKESLWQKSSLWSLMQEKKNNKVNSAKSLP